MFTTCERAVYVHSFLLTAPQTAECTIRSGFWTMLRQLDLVLDNLRFPWGDQEKLEQLEAEFQRAAYPAPFWGTVGATDGVALPVRMHTKACHL